MKSDAADQYLLADGTYADPRACSKGTDGVLRHENGVPVAMRDDGEPMTLGKVTEHNIEAAKAGEPKDATDEAAMAAPPAGKVADKA